jgi:hypothetical protein
MLIVIIWRGLTMVRTGIMITTTTVVITENKKAQE